MQIAKGIRKVYVAINKDVLCMVKMFVASVAEAKELACST